MSDDTTTKTLPKASKPRGPNVKPRVTKEEKMMADAREEVIREPLVHSMFFAIAPTLVSLGMQGEQGERESFPPKPYLRFTYKAVGGSLELHFDGATWSVTFRDGAGEVAPRTAKSDLLVNMLDLPHEHPTDLRAVLEMVKFRLPQVLALVGPRDTRP